MPIYIAMLRGINVSGHKIIRMEALRAWLGELGLSNVKTYVQSGNVVFETAEMDAAVVSAKIEQCIFRNFGFQVPVFVKTLKEMERVVKRNPFLKERDIDPAKLHVTFLSDDPPNRAVAELLPLATGREQVRAIGREVYLYCPNGYGKTKLSNAAIERKLGVGATTRNWVTVNRLLAMAEDG